MENGGESARGLHAIRVLQSKKDFTLDSLIAAAYDSYLPWFEKPMPALIKAWDAHAGGQSAEGEDGRADRAVARVGSALGGELGADVAGGVLGRRDVRRRVGGGGRRGGSLGRTIRSPQGAPAEQLLQSLAAASDKLRPISEAGRRRGATSIASSA